LEPHLDLLYIQDDISSLTCFFGKGVAASVLENNMKESLDQKLEEIGGELEAKRPKVMWFSDCILALFITVENLISLIV